MSTLCKIFSWSPSAVDSLQPIFIVGIVAIVIHGIFWIEFCIFPRLRQRNMMWLFIYLFTDSLILGRFFTFYGIRLAGYCLYTTVRNVLCYFEASSKFYMYIVQSYLILAFNVCRYIQIVANRNIYVEKPRWILATHPLIYLFPALILVVQFVTNLCQIWRRPGGSCDIEYSLLSVQLINVFITYIIPVGLNVIILALDIRHVSSIRGVTSQQIINIRRKRQRTLLAQTIAYYSVWLLFWSPYFISFQFINVNSDPGVVTSLLGYIGIALDPLIFTILDVRFLTPWRTVWKRIREKRRIGILPRSTEVQRAGH